MFCSIGVFSINNGTFEVYEAALFCYLWPMLMKLNLPAALLLLGLVLGPAIEENFRRAMVLSRGDGTVFLFSPMGSLAPVGPIPYRVCLRHKRLMR